MRRGQFLNAENYLHQALVVQPDQGDLHKLLLDALMRQGKVEEANLMMADLPQEIAKQPDVLVARGRVALAAGKPAAAEPLFRSAMSESPGTMTLLWLSGAVAAQGREGEAIKLLTDWLAHNPGDLLVRNQLASSYLQSGQERDAQEQYQLMLDKAPDNVLVLNNLAWLMRSHDSQQALGYIEKAHRLVPENPLIMDTYAMVQLENRRIPEALVLNQQALDLMPGNSQILYHRALILRANGQMAEAIRILEDLVRSADSAQGRDAHSLLAELQAL
jgi:Tfp pilus assembly protein PilF